MLMFIDTNYKFVTFWNLNNFNTILELLLINTIFYVFRNIKF